MPTKRPYPPPPWTPPTDPDVQVHVIVPLSARGRVNERARYLGISRQEWLRRVVAWALANPNDTTIARF